MKTSILIMTAAAIISANLATAQDIPQSEVPSVILNNFQKDYPKASDVEWEMDNGMYNVEFEIGWSNDHEIWYDTAGVVVKHEEDIAKDLLPKAVLTKIETDFKGYTIDDLERITTEGQIVYKMELNKLTEQDWDMVFDANGKVLSQKAD